MGAQVSEGGGWLSPFVKAWPSPEGPAQAPLGLPGKPRLLCGGAHSPLCASHRQTLAPAAPPPACAQEEMQTSHREGH